MGMFAGIEEVKVQKSSRYITPGNYRCAIAAVKYGRTNQDDKPYFVVELTVKDSDNEEFKPGDTIAWMTMLHKYKRYFFEEVKGFVAVATDSTSEEVTEAVVEYCAGEEQPLVDQELFVRAWTETNQNSGKSFTRSEFRRNDN